MMVLTLLCLRQMPRLLLNMMYLTMQSRRRDASVNNDVADRYMTISMTCRPSSSVELFSTTSLFPSSALART